MNTIHLNEGTGSLFTRQHVHKTNLPPPVNLKDWHINSLVDLIVHQYHTESRASITEIYELAQKVFSKHSDKHPELRNLVQSLFLFFDDLLYHLKQEEQILFPNIIQLNEKRLHEGSFHYSTFGVIREYVVALQAEHLEVVKQFSFFRALTNNYTVTGESNHLYESLLTKMKDFERQMMQHMQLENIFLFPRAIKMDEN